ncbi:MAG: HDOD domain-containing protein [Candidatus Thiodiazotropha sp. (ex Semelilucina semeliformis)]|nr:HDOD domain-containing protein [Candidatus Thiodiazotropha sp. (ex Semelilucina semeliformis)]MCU7828738.1 HDOD domain-containing protein [Candidatus Thiodiazotropha sp. (ex Myrtea sp. 'scaly one' KF741663)]
MQKQESSVILFIDSDNNQLQSLKRNLRDHRHKWINYYAENAVSALEIMSQIEVDVVVCETQLTGSSGSELLKQIQQRYPRTTRLLFSGQALRTPAQEAVQYAHQFIAKPCSKTELINILQRVTQLRETIGNPAMEALVNSLDTLPSLPQTYQQLITTLQSKSASVKDIGQIIAQDIGMSTKILQMVNSAFFGLPQHVASPEHAVSLLGMETVTNLALTAGIFSQLESALVEEFELEALWQHSLAVATLSQRLANAAGLSPQESEIPVLAGLLHDLGKVVLATCDSNEYRRIIRQSQRQGEPLNLVESESIWCSHATLGAYLMGLWGLPFPAVEAVALHHTPEQQASQHTGCLVVYAANLLLHAMGDADGKSQYDTGHLESLLSPEEFARWRAITAEYLDGQTV